MFHRGLKHNTSYMEKSKGDSSTTPGTIHFPQGTYAPGTIHVPQGRGTQASPGKIIIFGAGGGGRAPGIRIHGETKLSRYNT